MAPCPLVLDRRQVQPALAATPDFAVTTKSGQARKEASGHLGDEVGILDRGQMAGVRNADQFRAGYRGGDAPGLPDS